MKKKINNSALETDLKSIREYYLARENKTNLIMNFDPKGEPNEGVILGQRTVKDFKSLSDEELEILVKNFRRFLMQFAIELRNTFRNIYSRRKQNKKWKKEIFIQYMLEITNINHNLPEILLRLEEKTFDQFHIDFLASLIESFILKWWCPENPEIQRVIYHFGTARFRDNSFFYANRIYNLITFVKQTSKQTNMEGINATVQTII